MHIQTHSRNHRPLFAALAAAALAASLAGCAGNKTSTVSAVEQAPEDYRQRHPIRIGEGVETAFVPVARGSAVLGDAAEQDLRGFLVIAARKSTSPVTISVPSGSENASAALSAGQHILAMAVQAGVPKGRVILEGYQVHDSASTPPVRVAYWRIKPSVAGCGQWKDDFGSDPDNTAMDEMGCVTQSNLAAMVEDPNDLVNMRTMSPADAGRRAGIIADYGTRKPTGTTYSTSSISTTGSQ